MVTLATPVFGGTIRPSLAPAMLRTANEAFLAGRRIEAAAKLKEALRRHLAAQCDLYRLDADGTPGELLERLREAGSKINDFTADVLVECEDVLALRTTGSGLPFCLDFTFELVGDDFSREGGAL